MSLRAYWSYIILLTIAAALLWVSQAVASLPDNRAWEMVSPLAKNFGDIAGIERGGGLRSVEGDDNGGVVQASPDGERITYVSLSAFDNPRGAPDGSQYLARRDARAGWASDNVTTPTINQGYGLAQGTPFRAFSPDLAVGVLWGGSRGGGANQFPVESPPLAPGAPAGYENYYLDQLNGVGELRPLLTSTPSMLPKAFSLVFIGATPNLNGVAFMSPAGLGGGAINGEGGNQNIYEWLGGSLEPVNVLPGNSVPIPENGLVLGSDGNGPVISEDGSRVVWSGLNSNRLFVREGIGGREGPPRTVQADAPLGEGTFLTASSDDSKVFFADRQGLTSDAMSGGGGLGDLYLFEPAVAPSGRLVDVAVDHHGDPGGAEVQGVLGASQDGSYVYFVANGVLDLHSPGVSLGDCRGFGSLTTQRCNLYLWHAGWSEPKFIARLSGNDSSGPNAPGVALDWDYSLGVRTARVSRDGRYVLFMSEASLTGFDNTVSNGVSCGTNIHTGNPLPASCQEVFLYEAGQDAASAGRLVCISCNPLGRPIGPSDIPPGTDYALGRATYQSRVLSEGLTGERVFFDSLDALVPQDTNSAEDVYEYEGGHVYLISDGKSPNGASFVDASANGNDVFFVTGGQLVSQDTDQLIDLYDARAPHAHGEAVGFPAVPSPVSCEWEGCRARGPAVSTFTLPSSATFSGPGNIVSPAQVSTVKRAVKKKVKRRKLARKHRGSRRRVRAEHGRR
jgi:hypothetical protein